MIGQRVVDQQAIGRRGHGRVGHHGFNHVQKEKQIQSVQSKLLAVVEKLETSEYVVNSLDRKEGAIEGEQDNVVEDVKQLNLIKEVIIPITKIITV